MKKVKFAIMAALVAFAASCNNDNDIADAAGQGKIDFTVSNFTGMTKATETNASNYATQITNFKVIGYFAADASGNGVTPGARYLGSSDTSPVQINGTGGSYSYANAAEVVMWPATTAKLNFQAFTPVSGGGIGAIENTVSNNLAHLAVNVTVPTANADQRDIMFAIANGQTSDTNGKKVNLPFQHAMAAIRFSAKTTASTISANVKSVTMANVISTGKVGFLTDNTLGCSLGSTRASYAIGMSNANGVAVGTTAVDLTSATGTCMLLPQTLTAWAPAAGTAVSTETTKSYIIVECKVQQNGVYLVGDASTYGKVYIPFSATWNKGTKYTYTINIGNGSGGYDENGNAIMTPISFTASAANWDKIVNADIPDLTHGTENGYEWVDLGLPSGLKWAACNVGAVNPQDYGLYFAWGEITGYTAAQVTGGDRVFSLDVYNAGSAASISTNLTLEQDAAHVNLGGKWRMPTKEECQELIDNCNVTWVTSYLNKGGSGYIFTSKINGNSVFFPASGLCNGSFVNDVGSNGNYWSASWYHSRSAWHLSFGSGSMRMTSYSRFIGHSVRGVCE